MRQPLEAAELCQAGEPSSSGRPSRPPSARSHPGSSCLLRLAPPVPPIPVLPRLSLFLLVASLSSAASPPSWRKLASIPDHEGLAGPFAGVSDGALLLAGGANFPNKKPSEGGAKVWHDQIFVLESPVTPAWRKIGKLPRPLAYGASVSIPPGGSSGSIHPAGSVMLCLGGSDDRVHYSNAFVISWNGAQLSFRSFPPLPRPCANLSAVLVQDRVYIAGGIETPNATQALKNFWRLDLSHPRPTWQELNPWPGPERMLSAAGPTTAGFYLVGGAALEPDHAGKPRRVWLRDAYRFEEKSGWKRLPDLPAPVVAAPSPMPNFDDKPWLLGGDDGSQLSVPVAEHRGFRRNPLAFDSEQNAWKEESPLPFAFVTTTVVRWHNLVVLPGGETKPGFRSADVWAAPAGDSNP